MKIAFLTSCLEPGRDGVGDYTTLLACECERCGHATVRLALNDPFAELATPGAGSLRLQSSMPWPERMEKAARFLSEFAPDVVSLQFVCYGFHPRGIDFALAARLREIIGTRPLHIMFHEIWIGAETGAPIKERLLGALQRRTLLDMVLAISPHVIHTSNPAYVHLLREHGITATRLPLFGSIPVLPLQPKPRETRDAMTFALFGTLHPVWPPEPLFTHLSGLGKKITVMHIGRMGSGATLWKKLVADYSNIFQFSTMGEQPPGEIAEFFSRADFGIATTPWSLIGKSATVAAMLEHGLPVIVNRDDVLFPFVEESASPLLVKMNAHLPAKLPTVQRAEPRAMLPEIAMQFLDSLTSVQS
jgi:glycosyltransferase involved in cell wall biosynthesis